MKTIGQTTITRQIGQSASDAEENISTGAMDLESSDLEFTYDTGLNRHQIIGMRFNGLNIPQGAYIESAYITFRAIRNSPTGAITRRIHAINVDAQPFFSSSVRLSTLPLTTSFVDWTVSNQWLQDQAYNTTDIKNLVQEVVNRPGWFVNSNMAFTVRDLSNTDTVNWRAAYAYDGSSGFAPILTVTYSLCSPEIETPIFSLGSFSSRCQGAGSLSYIATSTHSTSISYSLDSASLSAGNTINASSGAVTYVAGWSGTSIITATAFGCKGPKTATHTVTHIATAGAPSFSSYESNRCSGASSVVYTASAVGAVSYTYSIVNTGTGTQPTINSTNGTVNYPANWVGQSTITVVANGCSNSTTTSIVVVSNQVIAVDDQFEAFSGLPLDFNVLTNDLCGFDPTTVTVVSQPTQGILQQGTNGNFTFTSLGSYVGPLSFDYQVCNTSSTACSIATVTFDVQPNLNADPCATVTQEKIFYMPFPENLNQTFASLRSAGNGSSNNNPDARAISSISVPYPSTIIIYDHWEDGYEANILNPTQATTQIWGDGDLNNGVAPGTTNDLIPPGFYLALDNTFLWNRPSSTVVYDGKDKIYTSNEVSVTKVVGTMQALNVQSYKTNVLDTNKFGNLYVLPFGEDTQIASTPVFKYVGLFARAMENGTVIELDLNGDGIAEYFSPTLNEGEVWYYAGTASNPGQSSDTNKANDLKAGSIVKSTKKFGIDLAFGDLSNYGTRNIPLYPAEYYGNTYYSPLYSLNSNAPAKAYFVNPNPSTITINWTRGNSTSGSFTVAGNGGINTFTLNVATGTKFESVNGESFTAIVVVDDDSDSSTYDWAYTMLPQNRLSDFVKLGWAPGSSDLSANYNPIWVTPTVNTTIYVKYNGDITQGANQSPCGAYFDVSYNVNALQTQLIYGLNNDNSSMAIFNCSDTQMAVVWGQRPESSTPTGAPALDVGYTVDGLCLRQMVFAADDRINTGIGTTITFNVSDNDSGFLVALTPDSVSTTGLVQPSNGTVVVNPDGTITYTPNFGFQGTDSFEYRICGSDPNGTYCDTATVYVNVNCDFLADHNIVSGLTFMDINRNQIADADEFKVNPVEIELYQDTNGNGILNAGEPLLQTVSSDTNGKYKFEVTTKQTVRDEFNANAINNNDGTQNWATDWAPIGQSSLTSSSNSVRIENNYLHVNMSSSSTQYGARRTVNLAGKSKAVVTYNWVKNGFSADSNDWIDVEVASSTAGPWTRLFRFTGTGNGTGTHTLEIPVSLLSATTTIRFMEPNNSVSSNTNKWVRFDNIEVKYFNEAAYIVKVKNTSLPELERTTPLSPAHYSITFNGSEEAVCDYNFGFTSNLLANNDINQTSANVPTAGNVLTNDNTISGVDVSIIGFAVDLDGDGVFETTLVANGTPQTITGVGTISLDSITGHYVFVPDTDYMGVVPTIQYTVEDEFGEMSSATLQIIVAEEIRNNRYVPIAHNDYGYMTELTPVTINVLANDNDIDGNVVPNSVNLLTDGISGASCVNANSEGDCIELLVAGEGTWSVNQTTGAVTFTPLNTFFDLPSPIKYTVRDNDGNTSNPATIFVNWYDANVNNFFAQDDANSNFAGEEMTGNVLTNDVDPENDVVEVTGISVYDNFGNLVVATIGTPTPVYGIDPSNPSNYILAGTITISANGAYVYESEPNYFGTANVIYTACGQSSQPVCNSATLYLTSVKLCSIAPNTDEPDGFTSVGISTLLSKRTEWPNDIPNGFIALESKNKGFVITRTTSASIASPVEGMLIYDTEDNCFKLYNGITWNCIAKSCN